MIGHLDHAIAPRRPAGWADVHPCLSFPHSRFVRISRWCAHHRWQTFVGWVLLVAAVSVLGSTVGTAKIDDFRLPGTESQRAYDVLAEHSPQQNG